MIGAGGTTTGSYLSSSETYDPATGAWTAAGNLLQTTAFHSMVALPSGKALVTGGYSGSFLQNLGQVFDPATRAWSASANVMELGRSLHGSILLPNGNVLIAGGQTSGGAPGAWDTDAYLYLPFTNSFARTASLAIGRDRPSLSLLPDGRVLATGGGVAANTATASAEIYNPATALWTSTGSALMSSARNSAGTFAPRVPKAARQ